MKVAVITCYYEPDYVRNLVMRQALQSQDNLELIIIKNRHKGLLKYPEVLYKTLKVRRSQKPDAYFLTFRGQEILAIVLAIAGKKPVWFDEFIVPGAYLKQEKRKELSYQLKTTVLRIGIPFYNWLLRRCDKIIADTKEHAKLSSEISKITINKYLVIPVGTDESIFYPDPSTEKSDKFTIFYYSSVMQSLLGVPQVLKAAELLKDHTDIEFVISGGKKKMKTAIKQAAARGARIEYLDWIPFEELGNTMRSSTLVLGGPFGGTEQAHKVITGKTFQSLACGAPTVVGENKSTKEYLKDKENCLMVMQNDPEDLAKAFLWAKAHPEELKDIALKGNQLYNQCFSAQKQSELIKSLFN